MQHSDRLRKPYTALAVVQQSEHPRWCSVNRFHSREECNAEPPAPSSTPQTFNPATEGDAKPEAICQECGTERWLHRDGGAVYGLICPS